MSLFDDNFEKFKVGVIREVYSSTHKSFETFSKIEAINHAKELLKLNCKVSFSWDTYKDSKCIKNDFAYYTNKGIEVFDTIKYTIKKPIKTTLKHHIFFCESDIIKYKL